MSDREPMTSHVSGADGPALLDATIGGALRAAAARWGDADALVSVAEGISWSFAELDRRATDLAAGLIALGLKPSDRIGIWSPNNSAWALVQFAAARAGLILVTINPAYRLNELGHAVGKLGIRALVAAERFKTSHYVGMVDQLVADPAAGHDSLEFRIQIGGTPAPGWLALEDIARADEAAHAALARIEAGLGADDPVNVQFTSGTTGLPKGATLTHRNILNNGFMVGRCIGLAAGDRLCIPVPLYHCFGMVMGNLACVAHGAAMVYPAEGFDPGATLAAIEQSRCTHLYGVPTMFIAILSQPDFAAFDLSSLRGGIMAGAPCPAEVMRQVISAMNMREVTIAYGMTETSPVSFQTARDDPPALRTGTVGRVQPHLECKIVGPDGETLARGEAGELCTRGYSVMAGYWGEPEKTAEAIDADGWMHSGDLATLDEQGYCRIVGRIKDMVIRGGENIYPREIEEFLYAHPAIEEVAVFGVPDATMGEALCAWIRLKPGARLTPDALRDHCRGHIAHFKVPKHVRFVDSFPMTVTGKIQKYVMREAMTAELAGETRGAATCRGDR